MKRFICFAVAVLLIVSMVGCGNKKTEVEAVPALEMLEKIWSATDENNRFPVIGGDMSNPVDNAPGLVKDQDALAYNLYVPESQKGSINECAAITHMMNANTFTGAVFSLKSGTDAKAFAKSMEEALQNNQWICGCPDRIFIVNAQGNIFVAFGVEEAIQDMQKAITTSYSGTEVLYDEPLN